jgi:hypothetical protein
MYLSCTLRITNVEVKVYKLGPKVKKQWGQSSSTVARQTDGLPRQCLTLKVWLSALSGGKRRAAQGQRNTHNARSESGEAGATQLPYFWSLAP